jgi:plastocyanin
MTTCSSTIDRLARTASTSSHQTPGRCNLRLTLSLLSLIVLSACGAGPGKPPQSAASAATAATARAVTISIKDFKFSPQTLTIAAGTTVTWKNLDDEPHNLRGTEQVRSGALDENETYSVKFDKPGTYKYGCSIHGRMHGTIIVT